MRRAPATCGRLLGGLLALLGALAVPAAAQDLGQVQSPVLTIDSDRFFAESAFGQRTEEEFQEEAAALASENRALEADLAEEERRLTERRPTLPPEEFRELADAFDEKVQRIRRRQQQKLQDLQQRAETRRRRFLGAADPVLSEVMQAAGAAVIVERRSVFASAPVIDVTDVAIQRMNARIGDGADLPPLEDEGGGDGVDSVMPTLPGDAGPDGDPPVTLPQPDAEGAMPAPVETPGTDP